MLGNPMSRQGAIFLAKDIEGANEALTDIVKYVLQINGIAVTPQIEQDIIAYFRAEQDRYDQELFAKGIPDKIQTLLGYTKKSKLAAYCARITISEDDLFLLMHNCSQIGYAHRSKFPEYVPESRKLTVSDRNVMSRNEPAKFVGKIHAIFEERKKYMVHLFESGEKWHCFYYTYKDMEPMSKNHWKHGPHLHFVNYLWPDYRKRAVWESFDNRNNDIDGVHVRLQVHQVHENKQDMNREFEALVDAFIAKYKQA